MATTDEVELALSLSELVTGGVVRRAANTTTLRRMSIVYVVEHHALEPQLLSIRLILPPWHHRQSMVWDLVQWPALQDLHHMELEREGSDLELHLLNRHQANMESWVALQQLPSLRWVA